DRRVLPGLGGRLPRAAHGRGHARSDAHAPADDGPRHASVDAPSDLRPVFEEGEDRDDRPGVFFGASRGGVRVARALRPSRLRLGQARVVPDPAGGSGLPARGPGDVPEGGSRRAGGGGSEKKKGGKTETGNVGQKGMIRRKRRPRRRTIGLPDGSFSSGSRT